MSLVSFSCLLTFIFYFSSPPPVILARGFPVFLDLFLHFLDVQLVSSLLVFPSWLLAYRQKKPPQLSSHPKGIHLNASWWEHVGGGGIASYCSLQMLLFLECFEYDWRRGNLWGVLNGHSGLGLALTISFGRSSTALQEIDASKISFVLHFHEYDPKAANPIWMWGTADSLNSVHVSFFFVW